MTDYPPPPEQPQQPGQQPYGQQPGPQQPQQPYGQQPAYGGPQPMTDSDSRMWAMLSHLGIILFGFLPPLIIWLVFRERSAFVDDQGKEALNFSILATIAYVVSSILIFAFIGILMVFAVGIAVLVLCIMAGIAANRGESYRYPINWRIVK